MKIPDPRPLEIAVVTDGRAGNAAQALGLAEAIARRRVARIHEHGRPLAGLRAAPPARAWWVLGRAAPGLALALLGGSLDAARPDLLIGAGRRAAPLVGLLRRRLGVPAVQLLDPQMPAGAFDLVVAPEHDALAAPNALASLGALGRVTPARIAAAAAEAPRLAALPAPRLAVLIGGPGRMARWGPDDPDRLAGLLSSLAAEGWSLMVTTSRRTDPALAARLVRMLGHGPHLVHDGTGANPYPAMLGHARAVLVTADSVNMASEAASSGLPVHVLPVTGLSAKAGVFHAALARRGIARPFAGRIEAWSYPPLAEADRIASEVLTRFGPDV